MEIMQNINQFTTVHVSPETPKPHQKIVGWVKLKTDLIFPYTCKRLENLWTEVKQITQDYLNIMISIQSKKYIYMKGTPNTVHIEFHADLCKLFFMNSNYPMYHSMLFKYWSHCLNYSRSKICLREKFTVAITVTILIENFPYEILTNL